jgi:hypothetical protein
MLKLQAFQFILHARLYTDARFMWAASNELTIALWSLYAEMSADEARLARVFMGLSFPPQVSYDGRSLYLVGGC